MNENFGGFPRKHREGLFSAVSAGFFFVLAGAIFITTPNLFSRIIDFFRDFAIVRVPNVGIWLPAPARPWVHTELYSAVRQFSLIWGFFQIVILAFRFVARSPWSKNAETVSNIVFWLGATYLISMALGPLAGLNTTRWFAFWAQIIMLAGLSLIVRAIILAAVSASRSI